MTGLRPLIVLALAGAASFLALDGSTSSGQEEAPTRAVSDPTTLRCFGAASRDPERRCRNRELRLSVVPTPEEAKLGQNWPCSPGGQTEELYPCYFGAPKEEAVKTIALVGDSHAAHWRAAVDAAASRRRWRGVSLTQTGCPMTLAIPILRGQRRDDCLEWNQALAPWFERHPEIDTVFTSQHGGKVFVPPGQTPYETQMQGFIDAFDALPDSVKRIYVIRGSPWSSQAVPRCLEDALAEGRAPGRACALPRKRSLRPDLAADAAVTMRSRRVKLVDLTPFMCGRNRCFPVVGGALVHKDGGHMTQVFSRTLGPYLGRAVDRLESP